MELHNRHGKRIDLTPTHLRLVAELCGANSESFRFRDMLAQACRQYMTGESHSLGAYMLAYGTFLISQYQAG